MKTSRKNNIENIYKLAEFEIKKIINFHSKKEILENEDIIKNTILKNDNYKIINWYNFINEPTWYPIGFVSYKGKEYLNLKEKVYFSNKINYSSIIELLVIFEKFMDNIIRDVIPKNRNLLKNNNYKLSLSSKDIFFLTEEYQEEKWPHDLIIIMLTFDIIKEILKSKKDIIKKIWKLFDIKFAEDENTFKEFVEIRNIIAHLNWHRNYGLCSIITERKIEWFSLYLTSENIIKFANYIKTITEKLSNKIIEKYYK